MNFLDFDGLTKDSVTTLLHKGQLSFDLHHDWNFVALRWNLRCKEVGLIWRSNERVDLELTLDFCGVSNVSIDQEREGDGSPDVTQGLVYQDLSDEPSFVRIWFTSGLAAQVVAESLAMNLREGESFAPRKPETL